MGRRLFYILVGIVFISAMTYGVNALLHLFMEDRWWMGFWSAMFFALMSNLFNAADHAPMMEEHESVTEMALRTPRDDRDHISTYLDSRAGIDPPRDAPKRRK